MGRVCGSCMCINSVPAAAADKSSSGAGGKEREKEKQWGRLGGRVRVSVTGTKAAEDRVSSPLKEQRSSGRGRRGWSCYWWGSNGTAEAHCRQWRQRPKLSTPLIPMFLGIQHTIALVSKPRGGCPCRGRRNLMWSRSSGSVGVGSVTHLKVLPAAEAAALEELEDTSHRMAWTTEGRPCRADWRATRGKEEVYGSLTVRSTASWHQLQVPHLCVSEQDSSHGTSSRRTSRVSRSKKIPHRDALHQAPKRKKMSTLARRLRKRQQRKLRRWRPERGMTGTGCGEGQVCHLYSFSRSWTMRWTCGSLVFHKKNLNENLDP